MNKLKRSPWMLHYDASSCNGCDIEVLACTTPKYDIERFGIINTGNPFHADILLITGGVNAQSAQVVKQIYSQMPNPKVVVAVGICACTGGIFKECYNIMGHRYRDPGRCLRARLRGPPPVDHRWGIAGSRDPREKERRRSR